MTPTSTRLMTRTATRPIPMGHVAREDALAFGWAISAMAVATMWLFVNSLAAGLLAFTVFFYVVVYTLGTEAPHAAEHRDRRTWRARCRRPSAGRR